MASAFENTAPALVAILDDELIDTSGGIVNLASGSFPGASNKSGLKAVRWLQENGHAVPGNVVLWIVPR